MPADVPPGADAAGFSELSFDVRYRDGDDPAGMRDQNPAKAVPVAGSAAAQSAPPRSRNSYMRSRARRVAALQPK